MKRNHDNLPALVERPAHYPAAPIPAMSYVYGDEEGAAATIPLSHYLWVLRLHRWKILGFVAASVLATVIISSRLVPIYEATATIDIDRQTPPGVIGEEARGAA